MSSHSTRLAHFHHQGTPARTLADRLTGLLAMVRAHHTRRLLRDLDDRMLADIGLGRGDALMEANRPMWDLRSNRG